MKNEQFSASASIFMWTMIASAAFLISAQLAVLTYVCGNDPMLYMRAARTLLSPELYGAEAVRSVLLFKDFAPGYPLILALWMFLFGDVSVYWSNLIILIATAPLMWFVFRSLMGSERAAAFSLLGLWIIAFRGHDLHAPFLLYPFREVPRLFFVYAAYAMCIRGLASNRRAGWWMSGSTTALLAACLIREPTALILPGLFLGILLNQAPLRNRIKGAGWLLLPWVVMILAGIWFILNYDIRAISQFNVMRYLGNHDVAMSRMSTMLGWLPERMTLAGFILMLIGVLRALFWSRSLAAFFLLPAILYFVFYAYMQMHDRYFFSSILMLAPLAGYGLEGILALIKKSWQHHSRARILNALIKGLVTVTAVVGLWNTADGLKVWGPQVKAADVRAWKQVIEGLEPAAGGRVAVAVEQRTRYLEDMILAYTDAELLDPKLIDQWSGDVIPAHYFKPLNREALYATPQWLMYLKVYAHRIIADRMNLVPAGLERPEIFNIGQGRYEHMLVYPWQSGTHEQIIELEPGTDHLVWMDWGSSGDGNVKTVEIVDPAKDVIVQQWTVSGQNMQAFHLSAADSEPGRLKVRVTASGPLPARPVVAVTSGNKFFEMDLGRDRPLSANHFFNPQRRDYIETYTPALVSEKLQGLNLPVLHSRDGAGWRIILRTHQHDQNQPLSVRKDGDEAGAWKKAFVARNLFAFDGNSEDSLILRLNVVDGRGQNLAVKSIGFRLRMPGETLEN